MATGAKERSVFARYIEDLPAPVEEPTPQPVPLAAGRLLDFLQHKWPQPTIRARDIYQYGPHPTRDRESTLKLTEILVRRGWLVPMKTGRYDSKQWRIAVGP